MLEPVSLQGVITF